MSNRVSVLRHIIDNGESTRESVIGSLGGNEQALKQTFYQLVKEKYLEQHGITSDPTTTYTLTDSGHAYYKRNKDKPPRKQANQHSKKQAVPEVMPAPVLPNISLTAEGLADQVSAVLAENSELRNALVEIRSTINRLLGDQPTEDKAPSNVLEFGGDS